MSVAQLVIEQRGDGRPILFLHGLTFDHKLLLEASEPVPDGRGRRIYVDLPGHGATPADPDVRSAEALVTILAQLIDEVCAEPPFVVGHSYGAYLTLGLAAARPLAGVLLVSPVIEPDVARRRLPPRRVIRGEPPLPFVGPERETYEEIAVLQTPSTLAAYQRLVFPASERTDRAALDAVRARYVLPSPLASRIDHALRVLILCGRDDHWVGYEDALSLVRALPRAELEVVPDCGQLLPLEAGERYRVTLARLLG